jgi:cardiolipin synthase
LRPRDIPNLITVLRLLLAVPIVWLLLEKRYQEALALFVIAGISDLIDGFLAKHYGWTSELGGMLDPLADKMLLVGSLLVLGWQGDVPVWLVGMAVGRDVMLVSLAVSYYYLIAPFKAEPLLISKLNTLLQLGLVAAVLFSKAVVTLPEALLMLLIYSTGLTTLWSGCAYCWEWGWRVLRKDRRTHVS